MSSKLPFATYLYFLAQSINLTTAVMSVAMAAIVGASLTPSLWLSTVPYGFQFLCVMLMTVPASRLMKRIGRKPAFLLAALPLALSGAAGYLAVDRSSFALLIVAHALLGSYIAFANFNRFAATDGLDARLKPRAISLVVAGGVLAALAGPLLADRLKDVAGYAPFALCYAAFTGLALLSFLVHLAVREAPGPARLPAAGGGHGGTDGQAGADGYAGVGGHGGADGHAGAAWRAVRRSPALGAAIAVGALGYGIMNLLMVQASLHMASLHMHFSAVGTAIQWHVVAMFAPSFFTGAIIGRLGLRAVIVGGILLLITASVLNLLSDGYAMLVASLVVLGLGWNFTYVGGSALLARVLGEQPHAIEVQGLNDLGLSVMATAGAFLPALLLQGLGWAGTNLACIGLCLALLAYVHRSLKRDPAMAPISWNAGSDPGVSP
ncbi:MFS transporter [Castellaniella defragrans]|uniref:MFS family permease n=1 Tax=Castellaniella defragrans TaxID=75697 RepID=A0A7W9WPL3_CASDE|nr:MFS transporter [Castellaniella defragrans]KAB0623567.1 MFS transporter [Castellaniella defragrans]MBB6083945.1 MFS family permease [Castellaniella defragrans]